MTDPNGPIAAKPHPKIDRVPPPCDNDVAFTLIQEITELSQGVRPVYSEGNLWCYKDGVWITKEREDLLRRIQDYHKVKRIAGELIAITRRLRDDSIEMALTQTLDHDFFDEAPRGVAFKEAFVCLEGDRVVLKPHSAQNRASRSFEWSHIPNAQPAALLEFLDDVFSLDADRADRITLLREFLGASILGICPMFEKALLLTGSGNNGKSIFLDVVLSLFDKPNATAVDPKDWTDRRSLCLLTRSMVNVVHEMAQDRFRHSAVIKTIISGQETLARELYQKAFTFKPRCGHFLSCNNLPKTNDTTPAFWRRFMVLDFTKTYSGTALRNLILNRLIAEKQLIVSWAIEGVPALLRRGQYIEPLSVSKAKTKWKCHVDSTIEFFSQVVEPSKRYTRAADAFDTYVSWCDDLKVSYVTSKAFGDRARQFGEGPRRFSDGIYYNFILKAAAIPRGQKPRMRTLVESVRRTEPVIEAEAEAETQTEAETEPET